MDDIWLLPRTLWEFRRTIAALWTKSPRARLQTSRREVLCWAHLAGFCFSRELNYFGVKVAHMSSYRS